MNGGDFSKRDVLKDDSPLAGKRPFRRGTKWALIAAAALKESAPA
jgi:hypothetical protein